MDPMTTILSALAVAGARIGGDAIQDAYAALEAGRRPRLTPTTSSFAQWARNLDRLARSNELDEDIAYWTELARRPLPRWPLDHVPDKQLDLVLGADAGARHVPR